MRGDAAVGAPPAGLKTAGETTALERVMSSESEILQSLESGLALHRSGRLDDANALYQKVLVHEPDNPDALHLTGVIHHQRGRHADAAALIERAIAAEGSVADYHNNLGESYSALGKVPEAIASYRRAIELDPHRADAQLNLGRALWRQGDPASSEKHLREAVRLHPTAIEARRLLGVVLAGAGKPAEAEQELRQAAALGVLDAGAQHDLGVLLAQQKRMPEAEDCFRRAIVLEPRDVSSRLNLGRVLEIQGRHQEAANVLRHALETRPEAVDLHLALGRNQQAAGRHDEAAERLQSACSVRPNEAAFHSELGISLHALGRFDEAILSFERAIGLKPETAAFHNNLGITLEAQERHEEAIASLKRALAIQPNYVNALNNLAASYRAVGRHDEAVAGLEQAIRLNPNDAAALNNLAHVLKAQGRIAEGIDALRRAIAIDPTDTEPHENLLLLLHYSPEYDRKTIFEEHLLWARRHAAVPAGTTRQHANDRNALRRLRVGYVSPDFEHHPVAFFIEPILCAHDRERFEVFCYSHVVKPDATTRRLQQHADQWRDVLGLSIEQLADLIVRDGIDLLVDLCGHSGNSRLRAFALKPAPVQVTYLGYPDTTGMTQIDYRLTDGLADPPGASEQYHTEKVVRLPDCFACYRPPENAPEVGPLPALCTGGITFACLNDAAKLNGEVVKLWSRVLTEVQDARLMLRCPQGTAEARLVHLFLQEDVSVERLHFVRRRSFDDYLALHHEIDIALDPFPFNGHTTSLHGLWMGVPVVSLVADRYSGRMGHSVLTNVALSELAADSPDRYVKAAAALARDLPRLAQLRSGMRARLLRSPLTDAVKFTRGLEEAYRQMWRKWCDSAEAGPSGAEVADRHDQRGTELGAERRFDEAGAAFRQAISLRPERARYHNNLGSCLHLLGKNDEAIECFQRALELRPDFAQALYNLGTALAAQGQYQQAIESYRKAVALQPAEATYHNNLGSSLQALRRYDEAIAEHSRAVELQPRDANLYFNLGNALQAQERNDEAISFYRKAIELDPTQAVFYSSLGTSLRSRGRHGEALAAYEKARALAPADADVHVHLGNAYQDRGRHEAAVESYRRAVQLRPDYAAAGSNLVFSLHYHPGRDAESIFLEHRSWADRQGRLDGLSATHTNDRNPERSLRIGYVSSDFRSHSVGYFVEPVLQGHDRARYQPICYSGVGRPDETTARLRRSAGEWREVVGLSDERVAEIVREDRIDVLVDLGGHTAANRMLLFARKPAPIQVTYLGYPNTTGLPTIDYRITDSFADPPGLTERFHTEQLVRLDPCAWCYQPPSDSPEVAELAALRNGYITFGSFNAFAKINERLIEMWAHILREVPGSRLLLKNKPLADAGIREEAAEAFQRYGIASGRLELQGWEARTARHLARYGNVDIALDTYPYHGTTTTCEALWMGVPAITLEGTSHVSRVGVSLLNNAGLPELIAFSPQEYVGVAVDLAGNLPRLSKLRREMRPRMRTSPLMDAQRFVRRLELSYRRMWQRWCAAAP